MSCGALMMRCAIKWLKRWRRVTAAVVAGDKAKQAENTENLDAWHLGNSEARCPTATFGSIAARHHSKASSYSFEMADTERGQRIRKRIPRFRILIMGRANAGKTTILQRVCKTTEAPEVFDRNGNRVGPRIYAYHDK